MATQVENVTLQENYALKNVKNAGVLVGKIHDILVLSSRVLDFLRLEFSKKCPNVKPALIRIAQKF